METCCFSVKAKIKCDTGRISHEWKMVLFNWYHEAPKVVSVEIGNSMAEKLFSCLSTYCYSSISKVLEASYSMFVVWFLSAEGNCFSVSTRR